MISMSSMLSEMIQSSSLLTLGQAAQESTPAALAQAEATAEPATGTISGLLFYLSASLAVISSWCIVFTKNIVRMALYLLFSLLGVAGMYFLLSAELLAALQLIVYAGGTLILIIFGVMLTNQNPLSRMTVKSWELGVAATIAISIGSLLAYTMVKTDFPDKQEQLTTDQIVTVEKVGEGLLTNYVVAFEVAAVILLVVMIGAAYMARRFEPVSD